MVSVTTGGSVESVRVRAGHEMTIILMHLGCGQTARARPELTYTSKTGNNRM